MNLSSSGDEEQRKRAVALAVALTADTELAPQRYERELLARYQHGEITIDRVLELLDASIYRMVYRSQSTELPGEIHLTDLLEKSRRYNTQHQITGLLLYSYSNGSFVQVLEGSEAEVRVLYANIRQDTRHQKVEIISQGPAATRQFGSWSMAFGLVSTSAVEQVLSASKTQQPLEKSCSETPYLQELLAAI